MRFHSFFASGRSQLGHFIAALGGIIGCINLKAPNSPIPTIVANGGSQNPLLIYLAVIFATLTVDKLLRKKTPIDIILIPIMYSCK